MICCVIGLGKQWMEIAYKSSRQMNKMTGLDTILIAEDNYNCVHPSWLKCKIIEMFPNEDEFLVMDADIFGVRVWSPQTIFAEMKGAFCAVPDRNHRIVYDECVAHNLPFPDWYVNGGLMMFSRAHKPLWDYVWSKHPKHGRWLEQTALNEGIKKLGIEVCRLPRIFNTLPNLDATGSWFDMEQMKRDGVVNFHMADSGGDGSRILELQKQMGME